MLPLLLAGVAVPPSAAGRDRLDASGRFVIRWWTADDGLPEVPVTGIAFAPDGSMMCASRSRLVRFDGATIEPLPVSLTEPLHACIGDFWHIGFGGDGRLWVQGRQALACLAGQAMSGRGKRVGQWSVYDVSEGIVTGLTFGSDGRPICVGPGLALVFDGTCFSGPFLPGVPWRYGAVDPASGDLWLWGGDGGGMGVRRDGASTDAFANLETLPGEPSPAVITMGFGQGGPLALVADGVMVHGTDGWRRLTGAVPAISSRLGGKIAEATDGTVWISRHDALLAVRDGHIEASIGGLSGFPQYTNQMRPDRQGGIWATCAGGLLTVARAAGEVVPAPGCTAAFVRDDGSLLVGSPGAISVCDEPGTRMRLLAPLPDHAVPTAVLETSDGVVWVGTQDAFIFRIEQGVARQMSGPASAAFRDLVSVNDLACDAEGRLWAGTSSGLAVYDPRTDAFAWVSKYGVESPVRVIGLAAERSGGVLIALPGQGVFRVSGSNASSRIVAAKDLPGLRAIAFHRDVEETLWISGDRGVMGIYADGTRVRLSTGTGLVDDSIRQAETDAHGRLWLSTRDGRLQGMRLTDLRALAEGRVSMVRGVVLGSIHGIGVAECRGRVSRRADPRAGPAAIVFPTDKGLLRFAPPDGAAPQRVEAAPAISQAEAPAGHIRLTFAPRGMHLAGEPQFQTRLQGIDADWSAPGPSGRREYEPLPPGRYRFECRLVDGETDADFPTSTLRIEVPPPWWRRTWVLLAAAALLLGVSGAAFFGLSTLRTRRWMARFQLQQERERERARIARDIHDNLGAGLTRLALMSENARRGGHDPEDVDRRLDAIYRDAHSLARSVDEIVWAVNPVNDTLAAFASYVIEDVQDFARAAGIALHLDVADDLPDVSVEPDVRHNLCLAIREAVQNVLRHARATAIGLAIHTGLNGLSITIRDDGCGFDTAATHKDGQDGLRNMQARMEELGGAVDIHSVPGHGTQIDLRVPGVVSDAGRVPTARSVPHACPADTEFHGLVS